MTTPDPELAEAFRQAKAHLPRKGFICFALAEVFHQHRISCHTYRKAKAVVLERLAPWVCVQDWLSRNVPESRRILKSPTRRLHLLQYRQRWLDSLIKEFSE